MNEEAVVIEIRGIGSGALEGWMALWPSGQIAFQGVDDPEAQHKNVEVPHVQFSAGGDSQVGHTGP